MPIPIRVKNIILLIPASSRNEMTGKPSIKYKKYKIVKILLRIINGSAAGLEPNNISIKNMQTNAQKNNRCTAENGTSTTLLTELTFV
jgi:hypothetical protein